MDRLLLLFVGLAGLLLADNEAALREAAKSPYSLSRFVLAHSDFDWKTLWEALNVGGEVVLPRCEEPGDCKVELIEILRPRQVIVKLRGKFDYLTVYLRYLSKRGWKFGGYHFSGLRYYPPRHQVIRASGDEVFLTVNGQGWRGTGIASELQFWFDLARPDFEPVFDYTSQGVLSQPAGINREVRAKISAFNSREIQMDYEVEFWTGLDRPGLTLGTRHDHAVYTRSRLGKFKLDTGRSTISDKGIDAVYDNLDTGLTNEGFLQYNFEALEKIASGAEDAKKRWFRQFLKRCKPTREQRRLMALVRRAR